MANAPIKTDEPVEDATGESIKLFREQMGWSQAETAVALGCARRSLVTYESKGKKPIPRYLGLAMSALTMGMRPFGTGPAGKVEGEGEE